MAARFTLSKRSNGEFQFNLVAGNGEKILHSEGYTGKDGCLNGIDSVRRNSQDDARYARETAKNGKFYFNLKAGNGQIVGTSEMYESEGARENGIASVKASAHAAELDDTTA